MSELTVSEAAYLAFTHVHPGKHGTSVDGIKPLSPFATMAHTQRTATINTLPFETVLDILHWVERHNGRFAHNSALASPAAVCRLWRKLVLPLLYKRLKLEPGFHRQGDDPIPDFVAPYLNVLHCNSKDLLLLEGIQANTPQTHSRCDPLPLLAP